MWAGWRTWVDKEVSCGQVGICGLIRSDAHGMTEESCGQVGIRGLIRSDAHGMTQESCGQVGIRGLITRSRVGRLAYVG